jgi:putative transcriptional regulator
MPTHPNRVREYREDAGITQQELADDIGAGRVTVNRWEQGHQEPSLHQAIQLCSALDTSLDDLFGDERRETIEQAYERGRRDEREWDPGDESETRLPRLRREYRDRFREHLMAGQKSLRLARRMLGDERLAPSENELVDLWGILDRVGEHARVLEASIRGADLHAPLPAERIEADTGGKR